MGFFAALTLLFIALKVTGYLTCSWWWITAPALTWLGIVVLIFILAIKYPSMFIDRNKLR